MDMNLVNRLATHGSLVNPDDQVMVLGEAVAETLLLRSQVPAGVEAMRVPGGQEQTAGPIGCGQLVFR